jgi:hypothetical protein
MVTGVPAAPGVAAPRRLLMKSRAMSFMVAAPESMPPTESPFPTSLEMR